MQAANAGSKVLGATDDTVWLAQLGQFQQTEQILNTASVVDTVGIRDTSYNLAKHWDNLPPEQRMMMAGQIALWCKVSF